MKKTTGTRYYPINQRNTSKHPEEAGANVAEFPIIQLISKPLQLMTSWFSATKERLHHSRSPMQLHGFGESVEMMFYRLVDLVSWPWPLSQSNDPIRVASWPTINMIKYVYSVYSLYLCVYGIL